MLFNYTTKTQIIRGIRPFLWQRIRRTVADKYVPVCTFSAESREIMYGEAITTVMNLLITDFINT